MSANVIQVFAIASHCVKAYWCPSQDRSNIYRSSLSYIRSSQTITIKSAPVPQLLELCVVDDEVEVTHHVVQVRLVHSSLRVETRHRKKVENIGRLAKMEKITVVFNLSNMLVYM